MCEMQTIDQVLGPFLSNRVFGDVMEQANLGVVSNSVLLLSTLASLQTEPPARIVHALDIVVPKALPARWSR